MVQAVARKSEMPPPGAGAGAASADFELLFTKHSSYLWHTLRRLGVRDGDLEDIAHEVFLRVHAQLPQRDPELPIRPWLFGIALGAAANYRRLARHRVELHASPPELTDPEPHADESLILRERQRMVREALETVPLQNRAVLILHEMDGSSVPEIAHALGIGLNTAYSRLRLGRDAFRRALEQTFRRGGSQ